MPEDTAGENTESSVALTLYTLGHSNRSVEELVHILRAHGIGTVVDVRSLPRSRRNPHFNAEALAESLAAAGITYTGAPSLGGLRKPRPDSHHLGLPHGGFRAYADYMETPAFEAALSDLRSSACIRRSAILCAEADYRNCHRCLLSDTLQLTGVTVLHIVDADRIEPHRRTACARVVQGRITYPAEQGSLF